MGKISHLRGFSQAEQSKVVRGADECAPLQAGPGGGHAGGYPEFKCDPVLSGSLRQGGGFLPAYHMNKANWITVLLDGTVSMEDLGPLLDMSYDLADGGRRRR